MDKPTWKNADTMDDPTDRAGSNPLKPQTPPSLWFLLFCKIKKTP